MIFLERKKYSNSFIKPLHYQEWTFSLKALKCQNPPPNSEKFGWNKLMEATWKGRDVNNTEQAHTFYTSLRKTGSSVTKLCYCVWSESRIKISKFDILLCTEYCEITRLASIMLIYFISTLQTFILLSWFETHPNIGDSILEKNEPISKLKLDNPSSRETVSHNFILYFSIAGRRATVG